MNKKRIYIGTVLILQCSKIYQSIMHICGVNSLQFFTDNVPCVLSVVCILQCTVKIYNYLNAVIYGKQSTEPSAQIQTMFIIQHMCCLHLTNLHSESKQLLPFTATLLKIFHLFLNFFSFGLTPISRFNLFFFGKIFANFICLQNRKNRENIHTVSQHLFLQSIF